ncbi:enoyl-CoA hydratase/isomerase family protein [Microbacterium sp.]|uniref:enoyl-CoA hydratase/isomerase family protein n=1 Tax=Microbacterium sp. TaxID=51671 RepID=UPI0037C8E2CC
MATEDLYVTIDGHLAEIVLNRPDKLNAITEEMLLALEQAVDRLESMPAIRVLIVRGEGDAFSAGADLAAAAGRIRDTSLVRPHAEIWRRSLRRLAESPIPSIAAVHGVAVAGGLEVVLACDLAVLARGARFGDGHSVWGLSPSGGATQRLPRLVGERRAAWMLFSGEPLTAEEALAAGLVNVVAEPDELLATARRMAAVLASRSPASIASMKRAMRRGMDAPTLDEGLAIELDVLDEHLASDDFRIGAAAFGARTTPQFVGRAVPASPSDHAGG